MRRVRTVCPSAKHIYWNNMGIVHHPVWICKPSLIQWKMFRSSTMSVARSGIHVTDVRSRLGTVLLNYWDSLAEPANISAWWEAVVFSSELGTHLYLSLSLSLARSLARSLSKCSQITDSLEQPRLRKSYLVLSRDARVYHSSARMRANTQRHPSHTILFSLGLTVKSFTGGVQSKWY